MTKTFPYKAVGYLALMGAIFGSLLRANHKSELLDPLSILISVILPIVLTSLLTGKDSFLIFKNKQIRDGFCYKGVFISSFFSLFGTLVTLIIILSYLEYRWAIGAGLTLSLLSFTYTGILLLIGFLPNTSRAIPLSLLVFPVMSLFLNVTSFVVLMLAFS